MEKKVKFEAPPNVSPVKKEHVDFGFGAIIVHSKAGKQIKSFIIRKKAYNFGSNPSTNDIVIKRPDVAPYHCQIFVNGDGLVVLKNLVDGDRAVRVNDSKVHGEVFLCHNDIFTISTRKFQYVKKNFKRTRTENSSNDHAISSELQQAEVSPKKLKQDSANLNDSVDINASEVSLLETENQEIAEGNTHDEIKISFNRNLFSNYGFLITGMPKKMMTDSTVSAASEEGVTKIISYFGGVVFETLGEVVAHRQRPEQHRIVLIALKPVRTVKYLYALSNGIPCLHFEYLQECIQQNEIAPFTKWILPAGHSNYFNCTLRQNTKRSFSMKGKKVLLDDCISQPDDWKAILESCGAELVQQTTHPHQIDYVVVDESKIGAVGEDAISKFIARTSTFWITESIIVNHRLLGGILQFHELPLSFIFQYLTAKDIGVLQSVSKRFRAMTNDVKLWHSIMKRDFGRDLSFVHNVKNYRSYCMCMTIIRSFEGCEIQLPDFTFGIQKQDYVDLVQPYLVMEKQQLLGLSTGIFTLGLSYDCCWLLDTREGNQAWIKIGFDKGLSIISKVLLAYLHFLRDHKGKVKRYTIRDSLADKVVKYKLELEHGPFIISNDSIISFRRPVEEFFNYLLDSRSVRKVILKVSNKEEMV